MKWFVSVFLALIFSFSCSYMESDKVTVLKTDKGEIVYTGLTIPKSFEPKNVKSALEGLKGSLPEEFDWRTVKELSPIENQGSCGKQVAV